MGKIEAKRPLCIIKTVQARDGEGGPKLRKLQQIRKETIFKRN